MSVNSFQQSVIVQLSNLYVHSESAGVGVAVTFVQEIVNTFQFTEISDQ